MYSGERLGKNGILPENGYYKHFWWGLPRDGGQYDFVALGNLGQSIYVSPQADLIIVPNAEDRPAPGIVLESWEIFYRLASAMGNSTAALA